MSAEIVENDDVAVKEGGGILGQRHDIQRSHSGEAILITAQSAQECVDCFSHLYYEEDLQIVRYFSQKIEHALSLQENVTKGLHIDKNAPSDLRTPCALIEHLRSAVDDVENYDDSTYFELAVGVHPILLDCFEAEWVPFALKSLAICDLLFSEWEARAKIRGNAGTDQNGTYFSIFL